MRKYQFRRWPFMVVLFTGLSCPLCLPSTPLQVHQPKPIAAKEKEHPQMDQSVNSRQASWRQGESFPFGPQLLVIMH